MSVLSKLGLGPKRVVTKNDDGTFTMAVFPPPWAGYEPGFSNSIILTEAQVNKYHEWNTSGLLIQEAFPELTDSQREIILSGLGDKEFEELAKDDEDR
jgi:hypothetical protein